MHPGMIAWWHTRNGGGWGNHGCAAHVHGHGHPSSHGGHGGHEHHPEGSLDDAFAGGFGDGGDLGGGAFGVRRPLRFLAQKLELDEKQVAELARILSDLKTERAQAAVDHRRTTAALADLVAGGAFDETKADEVASERVKSAERLRSAVVKSLGRIHALLDAEQRERLAYLLRTGVLSI